MKGEKKMSEKKIIAKIISQHFGTDPEYYDVDPYALAEHLINNHVRVNENKVQNKSAIEPEKKIVSVTDGDFTFEYGSVTYKHRFSINRSLNDYEETTLNKCIRIGLEYKYYTMACDELVAEFQVVYRDEKDKLQCLCLDLHDYTFKINHKGDMMIQI